MAARWLRIEPGPKGWPGQPVGIMVANAPFASLDLYVANEKLGSGHLLGQRTEVAPLYSGVGFRLELPAGDRRPIHIYFPEGRTLVPVKIEVDTYVRTERRATQGLVGASACLIILFLTTGLAAAVWVLLRDTAYLYYVGYAASYALFQALLTGTAAFPSPWLPLDRDYLPVAACLQAICLAFIPLLMSEFCEMPRLFPRGLRLVGIPALAVIAMRCAEIGVAYIPSLRETALGPMLCTATGVAYNLFAASILAAVVITWRRGSNYAGVFLVGWAPLLVLTGAGNLSVAVGTPLAFWGGNMSLTLATWESLIVSLGLAFRVLTIRRERDSLRLLAEIDPLTGLLNRRSMFRHLEVVMSQARSLGTPLSLVFIDIDHFKRINDTFGHDAGDSAIRHCAMVLQKELRRGDLLARYGGEEFLLALPAASPADVSRIVELLRDRVAATPVEGDGYSIRMTASFGVAALVDEREELASVLARADQAMYEAKNRGRNRVAMAASAG